MKKAMNQSKMILLTNCCSAILLLGIAVIVCMNMAMNNRIQKAHKDRFDLTYNANRFMNGSSYLTNQVRSYAVTGDETYYNNYQNEVNTLKNRDAGIAAMNEIGITSEEEAMIEEMSLLSNQLVPLEEKAMERVREKQTKEATDYVFGGVYASQIKKINDLQKGFLTAIDSRTKQLVDSLIAQGIKMEIFTIVFMLVGGLIQLISYLLVKKKVIVPIIMARREMLKLSEGDLKSEIQMEENTSEIGMLIGSLKKTRGELQTYIGDISYKLKNMAEGNLNLDHNLEYIGDFIPIRSSMEEILSSLNGTLNEINRASTQVFAASEQVSSGAQALAQGTAEQAGSVEELAVTIGEISAYAKETAANAEEASHRSETASQDVEMCNEKMIEMNRAMTQINLTSGEIRKIVKTIEDIAFQTNILALNAAIEAARAGTAGKGFAVVAHEVRNLANKSAEAAKDTTRLVESSLQSVDMGTRIADETAFALFNVMDTTHGSAEMIEKIKKNAREQAVSIGRVTEGMDQISSVVQTNSATAEESAAASQEMTGQALMLRELVARFRLRQ